MSDRQTRARAAIRTVEILDQGGYALHGRRVSIGDGLTRAIQSTRVFDPQALASLAEDLDPPARHETRFRVINTTTLAAAWPLAGEDGHDPVKVAEWFHRLLTADPRFTGAFDEVVFAVLDRAREKATFKA